MTTVNTKTAVRRRLRFETLDELLAEIERLNTAERAGRLRRSGNWTLGQTLGHLATWIDYSYEGYPLRVPWFVRFFMRFKVKRYLRDGMESGLRIPRTPGGTYGIEALETEEGMRRLRAAVARLQSEPVKFHSPVFGRLGRAERIALNLRHAELHLGFLHTE